MRLVIRIIKRNASIEDRNKIEAKVRKALEGEKDLSVSVELGD